MSRSVNIVKVKNYSIYMKTKIGEGGQGTVVKGVNNDTGELVAVKIINLSLPSNRLAFEAEYQVMHKRSQKMKYVVKILDSCQNGTVGYIIMKYYDCDLFAYAFETVENLLPELVVKSLFKKICFGVRDLHREKIAHLDLKPENILIDIESLTPHICDFGNAFTSTSAIKNSRKRRSGTFEVPALGYRGTRRYSPPEMDLNPFSYDPYKADVYSLGVILYILLNGTYPIKDDNGNVCLEEMEIKASNDCIDLLASLLHSDPYQRIFIDKIIEHPYLNVSLINKVKPITIVKKLCILC